MYKLDSNHKELVTTLEQLGCFVIDNAKVKRQEPGQLDIWIGITDNATGLGRWIWVEIKADDGTIRPSQDRNIRECKERGLPVEVIRSVDDCIKLVEKYSNNV